MLDLTQFSYDEARLARLALNWVEGGPLPQTGMISSLGLSNPPLSVYLLALPFALSASPTVAIGFVGLANVLAVAACYNLGLRWFGRAAAWVGALLLATSPWSVFYARTLWANSLLPPFVVATVLAGHAALVEQRRPAFVLLPFVALLTAQVHWYGFAMVAWMAVALLLFWRRVPVGPLLAGATLGLLTWVPYLLYQQAHWMEEGAQALARLGSPASIDGAAARLAWMLTTGGGIHALAGAEGYRPFLALVPPYEWVWTLLGVVALAALFYQARQLARGGRERQIAALLLLWVACTLVPYARHSVAVHLHYLAPLLPAPFMAIGGLVAALATRRPAWGRGLGAFVVMVALSQVLVVSSLIRFVGHHATPGGMSTPLAFWLDVAARIREAPVCEVKVVSEGEWPLYHTTPAIFDALLPNDQRLLFFKATTELPDPVLADGRTLVVVPPLPAQAAPYARALANAPSSMASVRLRAGEGAVRLLYDDGGRAAARPGTLAPARFANGVRLLGYAVSGTAVPGQTVRLFLHWQLVAQPAGEIYVYNHLLDGTGQRWGQQDGLVCAPNQWHDGQRVWTWYDIPIDQAAPPGPYQVRTGLYLYPAISNLAVLDADGQPQSDGVTLDVK